MEPVVFDIRDDIRNGVEPFQKIMAAARGLKPGQPLVIINSLEPRPLYRVFAIQGFRRVTEELEDGHWKVTFYQKDRR